MQRGASTNGNANVKFATVTKRGFVERVDENTQGAVARKLEKGDNIGKVVYELIHSQIIGRVLKVERKDSDMYGASYEIHLDTSYNGNNEKYILGLKRNSGVARNLIKQLVNLDTSKDVKLIHRFEEPQAGYQYGQTKVGAIQEGEDGKNHYVKYSYTVANPEGIPAPSEFTDDDGNKRKSYKDQNDFLEEKLNALVFPTVEAGADSEDRTPFESVEEGDNGEDLPF